MMDTTLLHPLFFNSKAAIIFQAFAVNIFPCQANIVCLSSNIEEVFSLPRDNRRKTLGLRLTEPSEK